MSSTATLERKRSYHLRELEIALDPDDPGHVSPPDVAQDQMVLDVGCGAGQTLIAAYGGRSGFGVDIDFEALRLGRNLGCAAPLACARAEELPFRNGSFELVVARSSLQYTDLRQSLPEIRRVLASGGVAWMIVDSFGAVWNVPKGYHPKAWLRLLYVALNSVLFRLSGRQIPFTGRHETVHTRKGICRALTAAGFTEVTVEPLIRRWTPAKGSPAKHARDSLLWVVTGKAI